MGVSAWLERIGTVQEENNMKNRIMHKDFAKAFKLILVVFIVLAVFTAVAIPLSLSQQISDASHFRQQA